MVGWLEIKFQIQSGNIFVSLFYFRKRVKNLVCISV